MLMKHYLTKWWLSVCLVIVIFMVCLSLGSVNVPFSETVKALNHLLTNRGSAGEYYSIIAAIRLPRVMAAALVGAALALSGAVMQGLLQNPLADGSTLGVSSGASLGAMLAILMNGTLPQFSIANTSLLAMLFAFLSLIIVISLSYQLDRNLSNQTIILMGVIFSMFISSISTMLITIARDKLESIIFWSLGSLASINYQEVGVLLIVISITGLIVFNRRRELNAFALGEANAHHIGVNVPRERLILLICASALIGVTVAVSGTIAFVGLIIPHITRIITGPNHERLLPFSITVGASFLMLSDLVARTIWRPLEMPIGVITSIIGTLIFIYLFAKRKWGHHA